MKVSVLPVCHVGLGINPSPQAWLQAPLPAEHPFLMHPYPHSMPKLFHLPTCVREDEHELSVFANLCDQPYP